MNALVAEHVVQLDEGLLLLDGEVAALEVGTEVVDPPEPAALPAPEQTCRTKTHHMNQSSSLLRKIGMNSKSSCYCSIDRRPRGITCLLGQGAPVGVAELLNVGDEAHVLLGRPGAPVEPDLGAARCPAFPHRPLPPSYELPIRLLQTAS